MDNASFRANPRDYALQIIEECQADYASMLIACLNFMSHDDVREMLDNNEWSPRFLDDEENSDDDEDDDDNEDSEIVDLPANGYWDEQLNCYVVPKA